MGDSDMDLNEDQVAASTIRAANASDAPVLARMRFLFRASLGATEEDEDAFVGRCGQWMAEALGPGGAWHCWVAELDDAVIGHLWLQIIDKIPNPVIELEKHAYISNVFVVANARRRGLGGRLMGVALDFCREAGVDSVILWPTHESRSLYRRFGFEERGNVVEAVLDPGRHLP